MTDATTAAIRHRIATMLVADPATVEVADDAGLLWALVGAELVAELRRHRGRSLGELPSESPADGPLARLVHAAAEVLGDRSFTAGELVAAGAGDSPHRVALALATCALVGVRPGEVVSADRVGRRLAKATKDGRRRIGDLVIERLSDHRSGAARWRVVDAADVADD